MVSPSVAPPAAATRLRAVGLRVTKPRVAVLGVLDAAHAAHEHLTVAVVAQRARPALGTVSIQAVYDSLSALTRTGLLRAIEPAGHPARYETRVHDGHHHLVCRSCGHIVDVAGVQGADLCLAAPDASGFAVTATEVTFWGLCPACAGREIPGHQPSSVSHRREVYR